MFKILTRKIYEGLERRTESERKNKTWLHGGVADQEKSMDDEVGGGFGLHNEHLRRVS